METTENTQRSSKHANGLRTRPVTFLTQPLLAVSKVETQKSRQTLSAPMTVLSPAGDVTICNRIQPSSSDGSCRCSLSPADVSPSRCI
ncbi:hypothetical protein J6590_083113 [Homalodisca vitripennis]|nr:hypothetical protein J6590_083113 [Homalodisca vitripennis]